MPDDAARAAALLILGGVFGTGCGGADFPAQVGEGAVADLAGGACEVVVAAPPDEGAGHTRTCGAVSYASKPPASGTHYGTWPVFRVYDKPVPWGFLVHALEHGAVVLAYQCADGCPAAVAEAKALVAATPPRPACPRPPVILTPDPTLDVPWAAAAWGHTLRARCFDRERFGKFIERRRDRGPELFPDDCGATDLEAAGWCPAGSP